MWLFYKSYNYDASGGYPGEFNVQLLNGSYKYRLDVNVSITNTGGFINFSVSSVMEGMSMVFKDSNRYVTYTNMLQNADLIIDGFDACLNVGVYYWVD